VLTDLQHASGSLPTASRTVVMGVLNVTPDSFSDGGLVVDPTGGPGRAIERGLQLVAEGADCIDVGGESTRPGADPVDPDEERARVVPVVAGLVAQGVVVSIDTRRASVAREALAAGASLVNDVGALAPDEGMLEQVAEAGAGYIMMHLRGTPRTMQDAPEYTDVVAEVTAELRMAMQRAQAAGVAPGAIALDPGIGFGKTLAHNLALLAALPRLVAIGRPVLVGTSRKSFLGRLTGIGTPADRLAGSLASAVLAARDGARILRVHDVAATVEALTVQAAVDAHRPPDRAPDGTTDRTTDRTTEERSHD
jgi:dihydropteroate synthase